MNPIETASALTLNALMHLPAAIKRPLAGKPISIDGLQLDLDMQLIVKLANLNNQVPPSRDPQQLKLSRRLFDSGIRALEGRKVPMQTRTLFVCEQAPYLPARLYYSDHADDALLIYLHGGGFVHGNLDSHDNLCRHLARITGARVLSVEYQKAPENPWPIPVNDTIRAYEDIMQRLPEFGLVDPVIAVAGDSAGGKLTTVLCRKLAQMEIRQPAAQLLFYPSTDSLRQNGSRTLFADGFLLTENNVQIYTDCYVPPQQDRSHPDISPLYATTEELASSPPAVVVTAGFDPLRDEGRDYAKKLQAAGVPVEWLEFPGMVHGFVNILCSPAALKAVETSGQALRKLMYSHLA